MRALALVRLTGIVLAFSWAPLFAETGWRAGTGRVDITPSGPAWLSGYASRDSRSTGILGPIEVKALALEDARGRRLVAITCDLLTMPRTLAEPVARELASRWALPRSRILLTASHSHSAPVIRDALIGMYPLSSADFREIDEYTERVRNALVGAADQALASLRPARVAVGTGRATFAKNRRNVTPNDPVDHDVPILRVIFDGRAGDASSESESEVAPNASFPKEAVLFAYACHNTTLNGPDICGDWAGFAQADLEERNEGLLALFAAGCGGDQNPLPRRTIELARKYGREMAEAVEATIRGPMRELAPETRATIGSIDLPLVDAPSRETLEEDAKSADRYVAGRARRLLETLDARGKIDETYPYV
ncbi:MAG TPA: neutral/alkaline non-lysosomal ceramidase N-terminal domain-containing protein, partial [Planctomycetota bacterium]|nr:neutral/alkaline non-lysosomal ceramidase N-terminal domain-containing protein [Planctomycetota bacterium]